MIRALKPEKVPDPEGGLLYIQGDSTSPVFAVQQQLMDGLISGLSPHLPLF